MMGVSILRQMGLQVSKSKTRERVFIIVAAFALAVCSICTPAVLYGYHEQFHAGDETIELEITPVPPGRVVNSWGTTDCYLQTGYYGGSYYTCNLILWDPSWTVDYTMSAKITTQVLDFYPWFWLDYYSDYASLHGYTLDNSATCPLYSQCTLNLSVQFLIPDDAKQFKFSYVPSRGHPVELTIDVRYSDGRSASIHGGPGAHDYIFFCGQSPQPGKPKKIEFRRDKGGGPGG
jgi:hypothetical protein